LFVTKSRLLAEKVERDYISLLHSLATGPEELQYVRERIQSWDLRQKKDIFSLNDGEDIGDDFPKKFSELYDKHFPLFITMDTVGTISTTDFLALIATLWHL
jgi:hypothetical protein